MQLSLLFTLPCLLVTTVGIVNAQTSCEKVSSCSCSYGGDQHIDLSPLTGNPKWQDMYDTGYVAMFSYNPCTGFTEGSSCSDVAACQKLISGDTYPIGTQDSATFSNDPFTNNPMITYTSPDPSGGKSRESQVTLVCDQTGGPDTLTVNGENPSGSSIYTFSLSSSHCCPKSGPAPGYSGGGGGISVGTILVIVLLVIVVVYLVGGVLFGIFVQKKSGKQAIPNASLWTSMPGLIRDGVLFVARRGKSEGYSKI